MPLYSLKGPLNIHSKYRSRKELHGGVLRCEPKNDRKVSNVLKSLPNFGKSNKPPKVVSSPKNEIGWSRSGVYTLKKANGWFNSKFGLNSFSYV